MLDKDDQKREHSGLGMKMLLSGMAESRKSKDGEGGPVVVKRITPQLHTSQSKGTYLRGLFFPLAPSAVSVFRGKTYFVRTL